MSPVEMAATHAAAFSQSRPWTADEIATFLGSPSCFVIGDRRCFALGRVIADEAELLTLATHPDFWRQGLARAVMTVWLERAASMGATTAFLEVASDNAGALALYKRAGFTRAGIRKGYYPRCDAVAADAYVMIRPLP